MSIIKSFVAELDENPYQIIIGRNIVDDVIDAIKKKTNSKHIVIVSDTFFAEKIASDFVDKFEKSGFLPNVILMDAGKKNKSIHEVMKIYGLMEENDISRDSTLLAIGGGVIGDLSGFVASTWLRGMNLVHIPTTLMAMVDSSLGGKTAINFRNTINGIGSYYHPIVNGMELGLVDTLSDRDYKSGIAEVIKHGIIADKKLFSYLKVNSEMILNRTEENVVHMISRSVEIKLSHVQGDVREGGKRLLLNYGHTLGHSIEISTAKNEEEFYRHGEGVSIGIMAVAYIAENYLGVKSSLYSELENMFKGYDLPTYVDSSAVNVPREELVERCVRNVMKDKKKLNNKLRLILSSEIGKAELHTDVPFEFVSAAFEHIVR